MTALCVRCHSALDAGDLRCAVCALPVPVVEHKHYRTVYPQVLRCLYCAAAVAFVPSARAPRCGFCDSVMRIEQPTDPIETAQRRVPFAVSRVTAETALQTWLASRGPFAPKELRRGAKIESLHPLYWASWVVSAQATVTWAADSDAGAKRSEWAPHAGEQVVRFDHLHISASRGLTAKESARLAPYYDLADLEAVPDPDALPAVTAIAPDAPVESFDIQRRAARAHVQRTLDATANARVRPHVPGKRVRNLRSAALLASLETERVALPVWVFTYRYQDRPYRALVHGTKPELVLGRAPLDWRKVMILVAAVALALALIIAYVTSS